MTLTSTVISEMHLLRFIVAQQQGPFRRKFVFQFTRPSVTCKIMFLKAI